MTASNSTCQYCDLPPVAENIRDGILEDVCYEHYMPRMHWNVKYVKESDMEESKKDDRLETPIKYPFAIPFGASGILSHNIDVMGRTLERYDDLSQTKELVKSDKDLPTITVEELRRDGIPVNQQTAIVDEDGNIKAIVGVDQERHLPDPEEFCHSERSEAAVVEECVEKELTAQYDKDSDLPILINLDDVSERVRDYVIKRFTGWKIEEPSLGERQYRFYCR